MYAIIDTNDTIVTVGRHETDQRAQDWFRSESGLSEPGEHRLVYLDLAGDETPEPGDEVDVDDEGVAELR